MGGPCLPLPEALQPLRPAPPSATSGADHVLTVEILAIQLIQGIIGVLGAHELQEAVSIFEVYFKEAAIGNKKSAGYLSLGCGS